MAAAAPALAAKKPPPPPPLPPLVLDAAAPVVTVTIDGEPLRLRVDPGTSRHVEINASAARRLRLGDPARLVGSKPVDLGRATTRVGKVQVQATTADIIGSYAGRELRLPLAWANADPVAGADGMIGPWRLPHHSIRLVRRPVAATDTITRLPMRWDSGRGMLGRARVGKEDIDIQISPAARETIATAAAASLFAEANGGRLQGPRRDIVIALGAVRPVRDVVFAVPVSIAGFRLDRVAARVYDWSGSTSIPDADLADGEAVVAGRAGTQREWAKLSIGDDRLAACAEIGWTREPPVLDLACPAAP